MGWSLMIFRVRATRGRRLPSLDGRSESQPGHTLKRGGGVRAPRGKCLMFFYFPKAAVQEANHLCESLNYRVRLSGPVRKRET